MGKSKWRVTMEHFLRSPTRKSRCCRQSTSMLWLEEWPNLLPTTVLQSLSRGQGLGGFKVSILTRFQVQGRSYRGIYCAAWAYYSLYLEVQKSLLILKERYRC
ncbi:hypothetical protein DM860_007362 [Cuscuta australis]|uniref:Uncharacterized protein n=1 Tax=Cuscuta australis TaxID=267555 RepID=A0A328E3H5_9ASTE|nr:hypothetical protein DM860_007362 [Cuscuta australis]